MSRDELRSRSPLRYGVVTEQDLTLCRVRVKFPDMGQVQSYWLHVPQRRTMNDKGFELPDIGEEVACLMDDWDESGVVLGALYSSADKPAPGMTANLTYRGWDDGTVVEYDRGAHVLTVTAPAPGAQVNVEAAAGSVTINGAVQVQLAQGGASITLVGDQVQITPPPILFAQATLQ